MVVAAPNIPEPADLVVSPAAAPVEETPAATVIFATANAHADLRAEVRLMMTAMAAQQQVRLLESLELLQRADAD